MIPDAGERYISTPFFAPVMDIQERYPLIVTEHLAEARDFYVKWLDMEVTFELEWVVYVSRPAGRGANRACASWRPGSSTRSRSTAPPTAEAP